MGFLTKKLFESRSRKTTGISPKAESWGFLGGIGVTESGESITEDTALSHFAVFACINAISETIATLPLVVYRDEGDGSRTQTPTHPVRRLLQSQPNDEMTASVFRHFLVSQYLGWGNGYAEIGRDERGRPTGLYPLESRYVTPKRRNDRRLVYVYDDGQSEPAELMPRDILHIRGYSPDGISGYSRIRQIADAIGLGVAVGKYGARFFKNDTHSGGVIEFPGAMSPEAMENLKKGWIKARTGDNTHSPAILPHDAKWKATTIDPESAQAIDTLKLSAVQVCAIYRVPPHKIALLDHATFSNIEEQERGYVTDACGYALEAIEQEIKAKLLGPTSRMGADFNVAGLLKGKIAERFAAYMQARQAGWLSINDVRALENLDPVDGGDNYLEPLNMVPAADLPSVSQNNEPSNQPNEPVNEPEADESKRSIEPIAERRAVSVAFGALAEIIAALVDGSSTSDVATIAKAATGYAKNGDREKLTRSLATMPDTARRRLDSGLATPVRALAKLCDRDADELRAELTQSICGAMGNGIIDPVTRSKELTPEIAETIGNEWKKLAMSIISEKLSSLRGVENGKD